MSRKVYKKPDKRYLVPTKKKTDTELSPKNDDSVECVGLNRSI